MDIYTINYCCGVCCYRLCCGNAAEGALGSKKLKDAEKRS
jgi:phage gp36-like protein